MTSEERQRLIARYGGGYDEVVRAMAGMSEADLSAHPLPGKWSVREIVHHLADSEMTSALRLRKLLVEAHAVIQGYDQDAYASRLRYNQRPLEPALEAFRAARATSLQLLQELLPEDWVREAWHDQAGRYTTERWLEIYAEHAHNHAGQIRRLREALGR